MVTAWDWPNLAYLPCWWRRAPVLILAVGDLQCLAWHGGDSAWLNALWNDWLWIKGIWCGNGEVEHCISNLDKHEQNDFWKHATSLQIYQLFADSPPLSDFQDVACEPIHCDVITSPDDVTVQLRCTYSGWRNHLLLGNYQPDFCSFCKIIPLSFLKNAFRIGSHFCCELIVIWNYYWNFHSQTMFYQY